MKTRKDASAWVKFRLLMWKNFLQQWRHPLQTTAEFLLPVATLSLILLLRWQIEPKSVDVRIYEPIPAHSLKHSFQVLVSMNFTELSIAYSPESEILENVLESAIFDLLLNNARDVLEAIFDRFPLPDWWDPSDININTEEIHEFLKSLIKIQAYKSSADLGSIYIEENTTQTVLAAIEFDDSLYGTTTIPKNITYSLRFPERPRLNSFYNIGSRSWRTTAVFPPFELPGPRFPNDTVGGNDPGYIREMFLQLQHVISMQLISKITKYNVSGFDVNVQRYPHPAYFEDLAIEAMQALLPMFIMITFSYTAINITRAVTLEKELQLKETLKIMGLQTWIHWTAWFWKQFIYLLLASVLILIILKVNWFTSEEGYSEYSIFTNTPWSIIFFFLSLYLACTIFFCFMISGFFSKGSTAALFTGVIWFLTYVPGVLMSLDITMSRAVQVITCLSINTAMSYGFQLLLARESTGGMQWGEFMSTPDVESSRLLFGDIVIMMVVNCVLYMLVALYFEQVLPGPFGTPRPWYFLFQKDFWCHDKQAQVDPLRADTDNNGDVVTEREPTDLKIGVKMANLTKTFGANIAVNNLSLNIYDDQITVLLGHNGAGKSTTISMLTGNLEVTSGSIWLAGYDMRRQSNEARGHLGLCPQHNVIFNELTVREHFEFFARLKGVKGKDVSAEIDTLIEKLELQEKRNYQAGGLSGGQKRRLCVGIALSGSAKVVLLDEPTSGMDPSSRRSLWDLLQKEKDGRSIILTTHFMDEADVLGDRVAIMAHGRLQCVGSPYFLKQHYGVGYTLVVVKDEGFNCNACTEILRNHIPNVEVKEDRGTEVTYSLINDYSHKFEKMLNELERSNEIIKFKNYGLIPTTLEDVFMSVGSDTLPSSSESDETETATDVSGEEMVKYDSDSLSMEHLDHREDEIRGSKLVWYHVKAIWMKLWLVKSRSWGMLLLQVLVPLLQINATLGILEYVMSLIPTLQPRALTISEGYAQTETLLSFNGADTTSLGALAKAAYESMFATYDTDTMDLTVVKNQSIDDYYLERGADVVEMGNMRHTVLIGATFFDNSVIAWFSNFAYHDLPSSLSAVHNAILKAIDPTAKIDVFNYPLDATYADSSDIQLMVSFLSLQLSSAIGNSLGIVSAVFIMFYIKERVSRAKLLQKAAGIKPIVMWGSAAILDWTWFLIICLTVVISCLAFSVIGLSTFVELGRMYVCFMVYGAAMLPFHYICSYLFDGPALGFVVVYFINVLFGAIGSQIVEALSAPLLDTKHVADIMDYILQFFPLYSLITGVRNLNQIGMTEYACLQYCNNRPALVSSGECSMEVACQTLQFCCVRENPYFDWHDPGILRYLVAMAGSSVVFWTILMIVEYRILQKIFYREVKPPPLDERFVDEDVVDEARHVARASNTDHNLIARDLTKYYGKYLAVNRVSFTVSDSECFGLLGVNGAGKTTTFKMLMGDEVVSSGDAFVGGNSVKKNITKVHKNIGYCPQFDALFQELTGRETLRIFALLRGMREQTAAARTAALAQALGFTKHLDKKVHQYSGGNKRKLSTAVALMGRTRLVFVDEPTTGVDPAAKRQVWRAIRGAQRSGRGVVLTSHSMEECEALCSRLTIMVSGRFQCIGTPQHLKNKFSQGFTLTIKLKINEEMDPLTISRNTDVIKSYVNAKFRRTKLMEEYQGLLTYYLPDCDIPWSQMFGIMEFAKRELEVEDYSISQTTLEQIFLQFTKYQGIQQNITENNDQMSSL